MSKYLFTVHVHCTPLKPFRCLCCIVGYISGNAERLEERLGSNPIAAHSTAWPNAHAPHDIRRSSARLGVERKYGEARLGSVSLGGLHITKHHFLKEVSFIYHPPKRKPHFWMVGWLCGGIQLLWNGLLVCFTICFTVCTQNPHPPMGKLPMLSPAPPHPSCA